MKKLYQLRTFLLLAVFSLLAGTALAASETFDFSAQGYSNQQTVTSVSATNFTVAFDKGTNSNGQQYYNTGTGMRLYGGNIMTIASDKTITAIEFTFTQNDKDMTPDVGTYTKSSASWTGSATSVAFTVESGKGHNRLKAVTVTYEDATPGDTRAATTLTFNPASYTVKGGSEAAAFVAPTPVVMDDTDLEIYPSDGELSYGINVTSGDASLVSCDATTGYVLIDEAFVGAFTVTASYAGNNSYKPSTGSYTVTVTYPYVHAGTATDPFTVAEAIAKAKENGTSSDGNTYYTAGIISQVDGYNSTYHSITYWISDDGTTDNQLEVYSGKGLESADFAAQEDLAVGYSVVVAGELKNYNGQTPEYDKNNYLVSLDKHENPMQWLSPRSAPPLAKWLTKRK